MKKENRYTTTNIGNVANMLLGLVARLFGWKKQVFDVSGYCVRKANYCFLWSDFILPIFGNINCLYKNGRINKNIHRILYKRTFIYY